MHGEELVIGGNTAEGQRIMDEHNERARRMREGNADAAMDPREAAPFIEVQSQEIAANGLNRLVRRSKASVTGERHYFA